MIGCVRVGAARWAWRSGLAECAAPIVQSLPAKNLRCNTKVKRRLYHRSEIFQKSLFDLSATTGLTPATIQSGAPISREPDGSARTYLPCGGNSLTHVSRRSVMWSLLSWLRQTPCPSTKRSAALNLE